MKIEQKQSELAKERKNNLLFLSVGSILLVGNILQSIIIVILIGYAHSHHQVHFIAPRTTHGFSISQSGVSDDYLRDMTSFITSLRFNVTPSATTEQFNDFLKYISPSLYGDIRVQLTKEIEDIKHEHLTTAFYPMNYEIDSKHLQVRVTGEMRRYVGAELMSVILPGKIGHIAKQLF
ncbi:MAG: type IV conjugative transfer system protein TraE [Gammaproteobacteria bacterium]|nr:type IV conjugative transfer system protein TraE [Gammaproteobacteria bacterium]